MSSLKRRRIQSLNYQIIRFGALFVGVLFLTWFCISFFTIDTNLNLNNQYELPKVAGFRDIDWSSENEYAIAIDGRIVASKDFDATEAKILPTASTAKMILGLAIMDQKPFDLDTPGEIITITQEDYDKYMWYLSNDGSTTAVEVGEEISEYDALMSVFLASSNNLADTLAEWAFGSIEQYREYATKLLAEWGINHTTIGNDASGFSESTTSTAEDLAQIGTKVLENPVLRRIVGTKYYTVPVAGQLVNTNSILGQDGVAGIKTGYIGEASGYCLISGYFEGEHIVTVSLLGAPTRALSFDESLKIINDLQKSIKIDQLVTAGQRVGYYDSWWTGPIEITAKTDFEELVWTEAEASHDLIMDGESGNLVVKIQDQEYAIPVTTEGYVKKPTFIEKIKYIFGWRRANTNLPEKPDGYSNIEIENQKLIDNNKSFTNAESENCTINFGSLMLINPNFTVEDSFINARQKELVSISSRYNIEEGLAGNGDNLLDAEAAEHINDMVNAYKAAYPGHTLETRSCFRSYGTTCGRLCVATGASDHHTGLTCDLLDPAYGTLLDTDTYNEHIDWQWLRANSYKYGFIDRFPEAWAGGLMSEPPNIDENGTTGLFETWHYRYVGIEPATEIATGKYNNGQYDSLEHYLKARGLIKNLKNGKCN